MERPIVENKIFESLKSREKGIVIFVSDFLDYGNSESVKKALLRFSISYLKFSINFTYFLSSLLLINW